MNLAYGWAFFNPVRKVYYNLASTGLSVAICFGIVGMFIVTWAAAMAIWRWGRIEEKWTARLQAGGGQERGAELS